MGAYWRMLRVSGKLPNFSLYVFAIKVHRLNQKKSKSSKINNDNEQRSK